MASSSEIACSAAYCRTSSLIFIEQKCGAHMEQKWAVLAPSWEGASGEGVEGKSELVFPTEFEAGLKHDVVAVLSAGMALGDTGSSKARMPPR